ncbi:MAG: recombination mediator RecR [Bacteroidota bacterium]
MDIISNRLIEDAVNEFGRLPGIGKKTALRFVLYLLKQKPEDVEGFSNAFIRLRNNIKYCENCNNITDNELCEICTSSKRDHSIVCVVEDIRDVFAIENTNQYAGVYHVLGGIINPMEGIGPKDIKVDSLIERVENGDIKEVIMALSATMEGDTTVFYIFKRLKDFDIKFTTISRGVSVGDDLEYADEVTLGRSILHRIPYENSLVK